MALNIVLVEPEIPHNTGSIARTCALTNVSLHLIRPLGFSVDDKHLKRAGLDYWHLVNIYYYDSFNQLLEKYPDGHFYYATTKASKNYTEFEYKDNTFFVFGKETKGLPKEILEENLDRAIRIPMKKDIARSLNLANSVNIIIFEALRQLSFPNLD
ncbi:MAG: tRNA (uridine(34)/cytosine(34)/5-carboxymethylaminomethyluridine(34)-2'-O)-methyltransferase TrmL [Tissierella sp.]|nr:tRNA (uridine(34)/cytosine(34)/5-carboxymethylaminomethyluridine(34)-2'-O)-methyltransferase TrmL [Tissierella sp.]